MSCGRLSGDCEFRFPIHDFRLEERAREDEASGDRGCLGAQLAGGKGDEDQPAPRAASRSGAVHPPSGPTSRVSARAEGSDGNASPSGSRNSRSEAGRSDSARSSGMGPAIRGQRGRLALLRRLARHALEPLEHRGGAAEGLRPIGGDERHALRGKLRGLLRQPGEALGAQARHEERDRRGRIGRGQDPFDGGLGAAAVQTASGAPPPRGRFRRRGRRGLRDAVFAPARARPLRARASRSPPPRGAAKLRDAPEANACPFPLGSAAAKGPSAANAGAPRRPPPGRAGFPREPAGLPARRGSSRRRASAGTPAAAGSARTSGKTPATASTAAARSDTRDPKSCSRRFSRATKTASESVSSATARRAPRAAAASARTPDPVPTSRTSRPSGGSSSRQRRARRVDSWPPVPKAVEAGSRRAIRPEGGRESEGSPGSIQNRSSDGEGARGRAELLERIPFRNVRDEFAADARIRQRPARPPRRFRVAKAGDEVSPLLEKSERLMEPQEPEDRVVFGLARDEEPGVLLAWT